MSTENTEASSSADAAASPDVPAGVPTKPSALGGALRIILPAIFAAGAAYGATRAAAAHPPVANAEEHHAHAVKPPGPTLPLEPFLVPVFDANHKAHPMKMTLAVEFDAQSHDDFKNLVPRIRDAILAYLRTLTHEQATDPTHVEKLRTELVEKCRAAGAVAAEKVLVTDFVVQ